MTTSQAATEERIQRVVNSTAHLCVVGCCNPHCRRYWFNELERRLPEGTKAYRSDCRLIRPDSRMIVIFLDGADLMDRIRGLRDYELVKD